MAASPKQNGKRKRRKILRETKKEIETGKPKKEDKNGKYCY